MASVALPSTVDVAVIGAGTMGAGIALVAASAGHRVYIYDAQPGAAERAIQRLSTDLSRLVARGKMADDVKDARLSRLHAAADIDALATAGLVIEAIVENPEIKARLFTDIEARVDAAAILATNTSSLSITALSARLRNPKRLVGMHFFNPAPILPLVEVVSGTLTDPDVARVTYETAKAWGKIPVHCRSTPGFIVNRVARPFYGEALQLLSEGAADPATLDAVMRDCGGFRMGPFELMDLIGHDVNYAVTASVYDAMYQDPRYRPSLIQKDLVDAGLLGRKAGRGFYDYGENADRPAPHQADPQTPPASIEMVGDLGAADALIELAHENGINVNRKSDEQKHSPAILIGEVVLMPTKGFSATEHTAREGRPTILFDLCLDYRSSPRIALALPAGMLPKEAAAVIGFFQKLGKSVSILDDAPGLVVMRTVAMLINEAVDAVHQRIATVSDVDVAMLKGVNYPVGPLAWANRIGPDRVTAVLSNLQESYGDDRYRVSPLLRRHALTPAPFDTRSDQS